MKSSAKNIVLKSVDDIFQTEENRADAQRERVQEIPLDQLKPFRNHPFKYKYEQMGETTIAENREEASFIWDNYYDPEEEINEYELAIFIPEGEDSDLYRKFEEVHYQRAYDLATIRRLLEEAGMEFVTAYDAFTKDAPRPESERIYVVAREKGKSEK